MKKITLMCLLSLAFFSSNAVIAQEKQAQEITKCLTDQYNAELLENNPNMMGSPAFERMLAQQSPIGATERGGIIEIPLVIHVLHNGEPIGVGPNITDAQVLSQVTVMNEDFGNMAGTPGESTEGGVDVQVRFVMAQQTPDGCPTNGINRVNICQDGTNQAAVQSWKAQTIWDRNLYMNMWSSKYVGDLAGILGYAQFPGGSATTDGVSAGHTYFGSSDYDDGTFNTAPPYDKGRTMTHEVGHYLGLYHTFQGGCGGAGDEVADTPEVAAPNYGCPNTVSCGSADMVENYMDYTDDTCMNTYTAGQRTRVQNVLASSRISLTTSNGADAPAPVAQDPSIAIEGVNVSCGTEINPVVIITNWGTANLTSATISYDIDGGTSTDYDWTGNLASGESESVTLPTMTSAAGGHDLNVSVDNAGNARACNDSASDCFTLAASAGACASVGNTVYATSTEGVVINDGTTDILSNLNSGKPSGYSDYTATVTDMARAESYEMTVNINTDGDYPCVTRVWVDWNQNCSFNDPGEEYDLGGAQNVANGPTDNSPLSFDVPSDAVLGNTIMRVTTSYNAPAGSCDVTDGTGASVDAEVEDYTINVLAALSVAEFGLNSISIYPNPTNGMLNISLANGNDLPDGYSIYNMLGQTLSQKVISDVSDLSVNTSNLSDGMYFIKLTKEGNSVSLPFIKK